MLNTYKSYQIMGQPPYQLVDFATIRLWMWLPYLYHKYAVVVASLPIIAIFFEDSASFRVKSFRKSR